MSAFTFDLSSCTLPMITVGGPALQAGPSDPSRVGHDLFQLWLKFQAQVKGMADPEMSATMDQAATRFQSGAISEAKYKQAVGAALRQSKPVADPGVDRGELMAALRSVKANMAKTGLDSKTRMELMGYAQALLDGLAQSGQSKVEMGSMNSWLLTGLGFTGPGLS